MPLPIRPLVALAFVAALAACQDAGQRSVALLQPGDSFAVARIDGAPAPGGLTLDVGEGGRITGQTPCNHYSGHLTEWGGAMAVSGVVITRRACADPTLNMAETRFGNALGSITAARRTGDGVALADPRGKERIGLTRLGR